MLYNCLGICWIVERELFRGVWVFKAIPTEVDIWKTSSEWLGSYRSHAGSEHILEIHVSMVSEPIAKPLGRARPTQPPTRPSHI